MRKKLIERFEWKKTRDLSINIVILSKMCLLSRKKYLWINQIRSLSSDYMAIFISRTVHCVLAWCWNHVDVSQFKHYHVKSELISTYSTALNIKIHPPFEESLSSPSMHIYYGPFLTLRSCANLIHPMKYGRENNSKPKETKPFYI